MNPALSLRSASWLYFVSIALVVVIGSRLQAWNLAYGLVLTEVLLILLPTVVWLRLAGVPLRPGLRLLARPPGFGPAALLVALGASGWMMGALLGGLTSLITALPPAPAPHLMLHTPLERGVFVVGSVVLAPLCEESLFRGALQSACERQMPHIRAIVVVAVMFAVFHLRPDFVIAYLPASLLFGFTVWKTRSLVAGMWVHFGNNAVPRAVMLALPQPVEPEQAQAVACVALVGLVAVVPMTWAGVRYLRSLPTPGSDHEGAPSVPPDVVLPLALVGAIFVATAVARFG